MVSFNQVTFMGYVGAEPEGRTTPDGRQVTSFRLAVSTFDKNKEEKPFWLTIKCWRDLADRVAKLVNKGSLVLVSGRLEVQRYTDKANVERTSVEVVAQTVQILPAGMQARAEAEHKEQGIV